MIRILKKITKNSLTAIVVFSICFNSLLFSIAPRSAEAQVTGALSGAISAGGSIAGVAGTALSCLFPDGLSTTLTGLISKLFGKEAVTDAAEEKAKLAAEEAKTVAEKAAETAAEIEAKITTVPVNDSNVADRIIDLKNDLRQKNIDANMDLARTRKAQQKIVKKETCWDSIAHLIFMKVVDKITLATVDWINSGFAGDPFYWKDPFGFLENIAEDEINSVTGWFTASPEGYPFGQIVMMTILTSLQTQFAQNMQFSLNQVLAHGTYAEFKVNFNVGGWAGYNAFLQPNNNPFGNYLLVNEELGRKISGTSINVAENFSRQLNQSGGFLSQRKCVLSGTGGTDDYVPADSDPDANPPYLDPNIYPLIPPGGTMTGNIYDSLPPDVQDGLDQLSGSDEQAEVYNDFVKRSTCKKWEIITPGSLVANQLTTNINLENSKLISGDELNENLGLIFDALLLQLVNTGLSSFQGAASGGNSSNNVLLAQVEGLNPGSSGVTGEDYSIDPPPLDVIQGTGEVDTTIFDIQNYYLEVGNDQALVLADTLVQKIRALDYCVPGPNPRWYSEGANNLQEVMAALPAPDVGADLEQYYAEQINLLTGVNINEGPEMSTASQFSAFMQNVFNRYAERMLSEYHLSSPPPSTRVVLNGLFNDMDAYLSDFAVINANIADINSVLPTLIQVQDALALIEAQEGELSLDNPAVQTQISIFESISSSLVTQDEYDLLVDRVGDYNIQSGVLDTHLASCVQETVVNQGSYPELNMTMTYPISMPYFQYPGLPGPDSSFLPGVEFNDSGGGADDINIESGGVTIQSPANLSTFEQVLQSVY